MKIRRLTISKLYYSILILLSISTLAYADGVHLSDYYLHLYEPSQKAVIGWDGQIETLILSSAVKSDDIANFAWVIPIQSSTKPEVTAGNISIFSYLVNYFAKNEIQGKSKWHKSSGGVKVLESKEIDIYDITILEATSSNDLIDWLNKNGYKIHPKAKPLLDKYVASGNCYFIANKINLKNKFSKEIEELTAIYAKRKNTYKQLCEQIAEKYNSLGIDNIDKLTFSQEMFRSPAGIVITNRAWVIENKLRDYLNKKIYEKIKKVSGLEKIESDYLYFSLDSSGALRCNRIDDKFLRDKVRPDIREKVFKDDIEPIILKMKEVFGTSLKELDQYNSELFYNSYTWYPNNKIEPSLANKLLGVLYYDRDIDHRDVFYPNGKYKELADALSSLREGIATPLKFEFRPPHPYYPLEISSLNNGETVIEVYVLDETPVYDINKILTHTESKLVNDELRNELKNYIALDKVNYVTRLTYLGQSRQLTADAIFKNEK